MVKSQQQVHLYTTLKQCMVSLNLCKQGALQKQFITEKGYTLWFFSYTNAYQFERKL